MRKKVTPVSTICLTSLVSACSLASVALAATPRQGILATPAPVAVDSSDLILAQTRTSPPVPPLPAPIPVVRQPEANGIVGLSPEPGDDVGVGHLRPKDLSFLTAPDGTESAYLGADWLQAAAIPIYIEPNGAHWGWIINSWLVPNGRPAIALGRDASFSMLHTYDELFSFPVTAIREDGWFQFQYTPAGKAWAHVDHLSLGSIDLAIETWESRFSETGWVEFRNHGLSRALNNAPNDSSNILGLIGPDSFIEPLAFEGDWMRVRVSQPADECSALSGAATQEGWMRWRDSGQPLVWSPPGGC